MPSHVDKSQVHHKLEYNGRFSNLGGGGGGNCYILAFRIVTTVLDCIDSDVKVKNLRQVKVYIFVILFSRGFQKFKFDWCQFRESNIIGNIQLLLRYRRDTYISHLKCNFAINLTYKKLKFCPWGFHNSRIWNNRQNFYR